MFLHDYLLACEISTVRTQTLTLKPVKGNHDRFPSIRFKRRFSSMSKKEQMLKIQILLLSN